MPQGTRLAIEHAMRKEKIKLIICTSTLAQGVNLPIQYLIVTGVMQGASRIMARDFQNLIGRAGRAGMHTEGTILFADTKVFDKKSIRNEKWRWEEVKSLLDPSSSEPCISNLTELFEPLLSADKKVKIEMQALDFANSYISDPEAVDKWADQISELHADKGFTRSDIEFQVNWRASIIAAIENFLFSQWQSEGVSFQEESIVALAEGTLAYHLAEETVQSDISQLFLILSRNISVSMKKEPRLIFFKRTLYGLRNSQTIGAWLDANRDDLVSSTSEKEVFDVVWPLLLTFLTEGTASKLSDRNKIKNVAELWMEGVPFSSLLVFLKKENVKLVWGTGFRNLKVEQVVSLCENGFAFQGALLLGALINILEQETDLENNAISYLHAVLKKFKYGLPSQNSISIYETVASDRVISQEISNLTTSQLESRADVSRFLRSNIASIKDILNEYPSYFEEKLAELL